MDFCTWHEILDCALGRAGLLRGRLARRTPKPDIARTFAPKSVVSRTRKVKRTASR
jgi:hypothetical protein